MAKRAYFVSIFDSPFIIKLLYSSATSLPDSLFKPCSAIFMLLEDAFKTWSRSLEELASLNCF